jgi:hypothetical protein
MNETLRPLNMGEILDRTLSLYRSRFLAFFGISAIPTGIVLVIACGIFFFLVWWGNNGAASAPDVMARALAMLFVGAVALLMLPVMLAVTALAEAAMNHAANRVYHGERIAIRQAYKEIWNRGWRYIWLYLLQALAIWGVPFGAWVGLVTLSAVLALLGQRIGLEQSGGLVVLLAVVAVAALGAYCIWMLLELSLAFPACVVEQISAWASLKRSVALCRGTRGRIFLLYLLGTVLVYILVGGIALMVGIILALVPGFNTPQHQQTLGMTVIFVYYGAGFAVQAFTKPVYGIALVLFYYDQRIRQEGFDIEWMMQQAGLVAPAVASPEAQPWMAAGGLAAQTPPPHAEASSTPVESIVEAERPAGDATPDLVAAVEAAKPTHVSGDPV